MIVTLEAVVPVLVGPLQTLLALAPALLVALGALLMALFTPRGLKRLVGFFWHQKLMTLAILALMASVWTGYPWSKWFARHHAGSTVDVTNDVWPTFRGGIDRRGVARANGASEPRSAGVNWEHAVDPTVFSSPCVVGNQVLFSTATGIGPFSPAGRGAIVSVDAKTGRELWRYAPDGFRATFCSPVVAEGRVVCGEGLHLVQDARVTCLDLTGRRIWEFRTQSHVEATPCIAEGRVFVGAGDDGFYCLSLHEMVDGTPRVLWHLPGREFPDCESPPAVHDGVVYFGLGQGGQAICAVDAKTGELRWKTSTPFPVFAPPTIVAPRATQPGMLIAALGRGNFVQSATDLLAAKLDELREANAPDAELDEARRTLGPAGELWWLDLQTGERLRRFAAGDTILGGAAFQKDSLYFGSRDGRLYRVSLDARPLAQWNSHEPILTSPIVADEHVYVVTQSGRLYALQHESLASRWDMSLGTGGNFLSSPLLALGKIYVGTPENGLRCVGRDVPTEPTCWTSGATGGAADDRPLPEAVAVAWTESVCEERASRVWAVAPAEKHVVAVCNVSDATRIAIYATAVDSPSATRRRGTCRLPQPTVLPAVVVDERVILATASDSAGECRLFAISIPDASTAWSLPLGSHRPRAITAERGRVFVADDHAVTAVDAARGTRLYSVAHPSQFTDGVVSLHVAQDLLTVASGRAWQILDAPTGVALGGSAQPAADVIEGITRTDDRLLLDRRSSVTAIDAASGLQLWHAPLGSRVASAVVREELVAWPLATGELQLLDASDGQERLRITADSSEFPALVTRDQIVVRQGESLVRCHVDDGVEATWFEWKSEDERPATPLVERGGRVYFLTATGRLVCLSESVP